ncbi:hypothetical protein JXQ70_01770 [bacterium]|nr:hypothetical protein [bacterium]
MNKREIYRYLIQNTVIFAPILFSGEFDQSDKIVNTVLGYVLMTLFSLQHLDIFRTDRGPMHSQKNILGVHLVLGLVLIVISFTLDRYFGTFCVFYLIVRYLHMIWLKTIAIVNVAILPAELALKGAAGAALIGVPLAGWGLICLFLLGLFLSLGKTKNAARFNTQRAHFGPVYTPKLLNEMMAVVSSSAIVAYCLYTISEDTVLAVRTGHLIFTVPFVLYGIFRYIWLINQVDLRAEVELYCIKDRPMCLNLIGWIGSILIILRYYSS